MNKNTIPNIWTAQEKVLHLYKMLALGLGVLCLVILIALIAQFYRNPIVVVRSGESQKFYPTQRKRSPVGKDDVEDFTNRYLTSLYVWSEFNNDHLSMELAPFSDPGLIPKVLDAQNQKYLKQLKGKHLEQAITFVKVDVQSDRVVASFDRVLKIEGIPLIIPTMVTLSMVQGPATALNPMGIYVSAITEADGAK